MSDPAERYKEAARTAAHLKETFSKKRQEIVLNLKREGRSWA